MKNPAKFTTKTKREIFERDKVCIFCGKPIQDFHHCLYGLDSEYTKDRNKANKGVGLCRNCHLECHGTKRTEGKRELAINYIKGLK